MSTNSVSQWRIYCNTESAWVYSWETAAPTTCNNDTGHTVNSNSAQIVDTINKQMVEVQNQYKDPLQMIRAASQNVLIDLKSFHGLNSKNTTTVTGTGTITAVSETVPEIDLYINGASDSAKIRSSKRGFYIAGLVSEVGVGIRIPVALDTASTLKFGYFDSDNGYYFKLVGTALYACILYNGTETSIENEDFNLNRLDGTESNGITLDFTKGNIFRIEFTWYGFGQIVFGVIQTDNTNTQKFFPMHAYNSGNTTTCANPYLPINVELESNSSTLARNVYVAGRQYSIIGNVPQDYFKSMYYLNGVSSTDTSTNYLLSVKHKTDFHTCPVEIKRIRAVSNVNTVLQIVKNCTLTSSSFANNTQVAESCLLVDTSSTAFSGGVVYQTFLLFAGVPFDISLSQVDIYETDTVTFTWKCTTTSNSLSLEVHFDEKW